MGCKKLIGFVLIGFLLMSGLKAQEVIFSRLSLNDGLASNFVLSVWQSKNGYLWIGTENGLQRYDGNTFISVNRDWKKSAFPALPVRQIVESAAGVVWLRMGNYFGRFDIGTMTFSKAAIRYPDGTASSDLGRLMDNGKGQMMLIVPGKSILVYNVRTNTFERNPAVIDVPREIMITDMTTDPATGLHYLCGSGGFAVYDAGRKVFYNAGYNPLKLGFLDATRGIKGYTSCFFGKEGIWMVSQDKFSVKMLLYGFKSGKITSRPLIRNVSASDFTVKGFAKADKRTWVYGAGLLNFYDNTFQEFMMAGHNFVDYYGIQYNSVHQVYEDRDQNIWIASDNGLYKARMQDNHIRHGYAPQLHNYPITSVSEFEEGKITISSRGKGIMDIVYNDSLDFTRASWNKIIFSSEKVRSDSSYTHVWDVLKKKGGHEIWYACQSGRMIRFNEQTKTSDYFNDPCFSGENIQHMVMDDKGLLWSGTSGGRIIVYDGSGFELKLYLGSGINKMLMSSGGLLWVGTENKGVFVIDPRSGRVVKRYSSGDQDSFYADNNPVNDILEVNPSLFALACTGSLDFVNTRTGKQTSCNGNKGLPSFIVYAMQLDKEEKLWLSTNGGLFNYDFKTNSFEGKEGLVKTTNEWNVLTNSTKLHDGKLLFTGSNSFLIFDPLKIRDHKRPYNVAITDFRLFNRYLPLDSVYREGELELDYNQNSISISFSSFNFDTEGNYKYYYRMIGADTTWIRADKNLTASFAALSPGSYTFMVKCLNSEGISSPAVTKLPIYVRPAYWQTWWFMLLMIVIGMVPLYVIYRLRINRILAVQHLRENVARDLHDDVGSTLTSINILSEMAAYKLNQEPLVANDYLSKISRNSSEMMQAMDDIVWSIKPDNDHLVKIVARMREYMVSVLESRGVDCSFEVDSSINHIKLNMECRRNLYLAYKEAINNIAKYAEASDVQIEMSIRSGVLDLQIRDNGKGMVLADVKTGNGLNNMRQRIELLKGTFEISSAVGNGTSILIKLILNRVL